MATALDITTQVRASTGKKNLLNEAGTDLSRDAYWHLNAAIKFLSRYTPSQGKDQIYKTTLASSARGFVAPNLRFINNISIEDTAEGETYLERLDYHALRKLCYAGPTIQTERPLYWARNISAHGGTTPGIINGSFASGLTGWTQGVDSGGSYSVASGVLSLVDSGSPSPAIYQRLPQIYAETQEVTINIATVPDGNVRVVFALFNEEEQAYTVTHQESLSTAGSHTFDAGTGGSWDTIVLLYTSAGTSTATINSIVLVTEEEVAQDTGYANDIIIGPMADQEYTVRIYGGYYPARITLPSEYSWWMEKEEECVVDAFRLSLEGRLHRNQEGENQEYTRLMMQVRQIQSDLHWEEGFGSNQDLRLGL